MLIALNMFFFGCFVRSFVLNVCMRVWCVVDIVLVLFFEFIILIYVLYFIVSGI